MSGERFSAIIACLLIAIGTQINFTVNQFSDTDIVSTSDSIVATEVRIHSLNEDWEQPEKLVWYPNLPADERFFQFSVIINGISDFTLIESCNLTVTWEYNLTSGTPILSTSLDMNSFVLVDDKLILYYAFQYPDNIFYGKYFINLETIDSEGNNYSFSHPGIDILQYGITVEKFNDLTDGKIIFSEGQLTDVEFAVRNVGVSYSKLLFNLTLESSVSTNWEPQAMYNTNNSTLWGGELIYSSFTFEAPDDIYNSPPPSNLEFKFTATYENDLEEIVELTNRTISFSTAVVPILSSPNLSVYGDENETYLIGDPLSQEPLENLVMTRDGNSVSIYLSIVNFGFENANIEMEITSIDSFSLWNCDVFAEAKNPITPQNNKYSIGTNLHPLEEVKLRLQFNFSNTSFVQEEISIYLENINNNQDNSIDLMFMNYQITNPLIDLQDPTGQMFQLGDVYQNESLNFQFTFDKNPYFSYFDFENLWLLDTEANNTLTISNLPNFNLTIVSDETSYFPLQIALGTRSSYTVSINLSENIEIGNYSMNLTLTQLSVDEDNALYFDREINFHVLENTSLSVDDNSQTNNSTDNSQDNNSSNNSQGNNSTNNSLNNSGNNDSNLTDNSSLANENESLVNNNSSALVNQTQVDNSTIQNTDSDSNDSTKSNNSNSKSWIWGVIAVVIIGSILIFIIQKRRPKNTINQTNKQPINIDQIVPLPMPEISVNQVTVLRQWTDANGYTWRQMSDRSMLWWNGHNWVPVNQNQ